MKIKVNSSQNVEIYIQVFKCYIGRARANLFFLLNTIVLVSMCVCVECKYIYSSFFFCVLPQP